ncbi:MAG: hypothetical protein GDA36_07730 [Rhodobacteraceae bacterium]|nr:hypothetical protein [Paracoccaceae bacterium]
MADKNNRRGIDIFFGGVVSLTAFAFLMGLNQVVIKVTGGGSGPCVAGAGLRWVEAVCVLIL